MPGRMKRRLQNIIASNLIKVTYQSAIITTKSIESDSVKDIFWKWWLKIHLKFAPKSIHNTIVFHSLKN